MGPKKTDGIWPCADLTLMRTTSLSWRCISTHRKRKLTMHHLPDDTRQALSLDKLAEVEPDAGHWFDEADNTDDDECWGQDPALIIERREARKALGITDH